jgi:predicted unusual protein kinase regulating ubiquinone biosynthesis (AarF/ABC1/UbiB family)
VTEPGVSNIYVSYLNDPSHTVAPGYSLAQGCLADTLPLVDLAQERAQQILAAADRQCYPESVIVSRHGQIAKRYADLIGHSRGVVMKASKLLSLASLPVADAPEFSASDEPTLLRCGDDPPSMPAGLVADLVESEFDVPLHEVFIEFDPHPLAVGSIGQVHAATLQDGRDVAVKIQYPGVERAIRADLSDGVQLASFLRLGCRMTCVQSNVQAIARELSARIAEEVDYRIEAANQEAFAGAYRRHPRIRIPDTVPELCTARVLTMDLSDGFGLPRARTASKRLRDRWGEVIYRFTAGSLTKLGMLNADPSPGNYLFHADGGVTFLDFGCVRRYSAVQVRAMQAVMRAIMDLDARRLFDVLADAGYLNRADPPDATSLLAWFTEVHEPILEEQPYTYSPDFAAVLRGSDLARSGRYADVISRLKIPAAFLAVIRVNLGVTAVLAELGATGQWAAMFRDYCQTSK